MEINKVLFLLRHGEAALSSVSGRDFDRPLKESGEKQLHRLSKTLKTRVYILIWSFAAMLLEHLKQKKSLKNTCQ